MFDEKIETLSKKEMRELQLQRLKHIVRYAYDNVPHYRKKFDAIGLKPEHIQTLEDIQLIPFTTKDDLRENYPYGMFAKPMDEIVRVHASSGTTGKPTVVGYTKNDLDMWSTCMARLIMAVGGKSSDIVQISFGYGLFTGAFGLHYGWEKIGATVIPVSSGNTQRQIMLMKDFRSTVLVATPSYALYIAETMKNMGYTKDDFALRLGMFGDEASTAEMHEKLSEELGILSTENYGLSEIIGPGVSGECMYKCGSHINEDYFYPEVVDKETLKPLHEGEFGELVITTLTKEGLPILRYRTKDITSLTREPCKCGRTTTRMSKIRGRSDDMLIIRGVNVFPTQIEEVLLKTEGLGAHYEIVVTRENYMDKLQVLVELADVTLLENLKYVEALKNKLKFNLKTNLQLDVDVKIVEPLTLKRFEGKAKRVTDLR